jgi:hypothetical protein
MPIISRWYRSAPDAEIAARLEEQGKARGKNKREGLKKNEEERERERERIILGKESNLPEKDGLISPPFKFHSCVLVLLSRHTINNP